MISAKNLDKGQIASISTWVEEGLQLSDIQKRLELELELKVTYMDTRFLISDLGLEVKSESANEEQPSLEEPIVGQDKKTAPPGGMQVTLDQITRPGALVSGKVTFSDGEGGMWLVDQMGRPGLEPDTPGYRPSEADMISFQKELQKLLESNAL